MSGSSLRSGRNPSFLRPCGFVPTPGLGARVGLEVERIERWARCGGRCGMPRNPHETQQAGLPASRGREPCSPWPIWRRGSCRLSLDPALACLPEQKDDAALSCARLVVAGGRFTGQACPLPSTPVRVEGGRPGRPSPDARRGTASPSPAAPGDRGGSLKVKGSAGRHECYRNIVKKADDILSPSFRPKRSGEPGSLRRKRLATPAPCPESDPGFALRAPRDDEVEGPGFALKPDPG